MKMYNEINTSLEGLSHRFELAEESVKWKKDEQRLHEGRTHKTE